MAEQKQRKQLLRQQEIEKDRKEFEIFSASYKFGNQIGGGAPVRDQAGRV